MNNKKSIEDYFSVKHTKFFYLLFETKKWKELYSQSESILSIITAFIITLLLLFVYFTSDFDSFMILIKTLLQSVFEASIGMLGFIISGLAIFTGTITNKLIKNIDSEAKINGIVGILFSFYYIGAIIGISIIFFILAFILIHSNMLFNFVCFIIISYLLAYLMCYSIFYSVSLLGTCLRLFFVSYKFSDEWIYECEDKKYKGSLIKLSFLDGATEVLSFKDVNLEDFQEWFYSNDQTPYVVKNIKGKQFALTKNGITKLEILNNEP